MDEGGWTGGRASWRAEGHRGQCRGRGSQRGHRFSSDDGDDADDYNKRRGARSKHRFEKMFEDPDGASPGSTDQRPERERPPPHLRGREIGMWYAARSKKSRKNAEINSRQPVLMSVSQQHELTDLLSALRSNGASHPRTNNAGLLQDTDSSSSEEGTESEEDEEKEDGGKLEVKKVESKESLKEDGKEVCSDSESLELASKQWLEQEPGSSSDADKMEEHSDVEKTQYGIEPATKKRWIPHVGDAANPDTIKGEIFDQELACNPGQIKAEQVGDMEAKATDEIPGRLEGNEAADSGLSEDGKTDYRAEEPSDEASCSADTEETIDVGELKEEGIDDVGDCVVELLQRPSPGGSSSDPKGLSMDYVGLSKDDALDRDLELQSQAQRTNRKFVDMMEFRKRLPSYKMKHEIVNCIFFNQVVVLGGETGCGKTTQVPQFILDDYIERGCGSLCRVVCTQPRRISAISIAERVAEERAEPLGKSVGYQIRLDQKLPRTQASILYCTTGIMLKWLVSDPYLSKTSHIVLDEIHERDILSDFLMIIIRDLMKIRSDLKIVIMSATLNAESFSQYFNNCPMLNIPGFTFPVKQYLLEDVYELLQYKVQYLSSSLRLSRQMSVRRVKREEQQQEQIRYSNWIRALTRLSKSTCDVLSTLPPEGFNDIDYDLVTMLIHFIVTKKPAGAILVFVPGWEQIKKLINSISSQKFFQSANFRLIPLHSMMPTVNQREVFERPPPGIHKIVIATNIAETSITIDDVVYVIDCGKIKMKKFDAEKNIATLLPEWVARANAKQRSGRAGRVQPGECYHLYTSFHEARFDDYQLPEMLRTRLEELCLQIKLLKLGRIKPFITKAMQPPLIESLDLAVSTLFDLKALDNDEELTPLGYHLARMPVEPHVGKMLLFGAIFSCIDPITTIAASLGFRDAFYIPLGREKQADERRRILSQNSCSDHLMLAKAFKGWETARAHGNQRQYCWENFMSASTLMMLDAMKKQFAHLLHDMGFAIDTNPKAVPGNRNSTNEKLLRAVICAGLYPNIGRLHQTVVSSTQQCVIKWPPRLSTKTDPTVHIHPKSVNCNERNFPSPHVVYFEKLKTAKIFIHDCTAVSTYSLLFFGGDIVVKKDRGQNCVVVDDWLKFKSSKRVAQLVQELRVELDELLSRCVRTPGIYDRNDVALLRAIVKLVTTEDQPVPELPVAPRSSSSTLRDHRRGKNGAKHKKRN